MKLQDDPRKADAPMTFQEARKGVPKWPPMVLTRPTRHLDCTANPTHTRKAPRGPSYRFFSLPNDGRQQHAAANIDNKQYAAATGNNQRELGVETQNKARRATAGILTPNPARQPRQKAEPGNRISTHARNPGDASHPRATTVNAKRRRTSAVCTPNPTSTS